jgi:hypothetical protein
MPLRKEQISPHELEQFLPSDKKDRQPQSDLELSKVSFDNAEGMSKEDSHEYNAEVVDCVSSIEHVLTLTDKEMPAEERAQVLRSDVSTLEQIKDSVAGEGREDIVAQLEQLLAEIKSDKTAQDFLESAKFDVVGGEEEPHAKLLKELVEAKSHGAYNAVVRGMVEKIGDKQFFKDHPKALDSAKVVIVGACIFIAFSDGIVSDTLYDTGAIEQEDSSSEDIPDADATTENLGAVAGEAQGLTDADKKRMPPAEGAKRKWWQKK